MRQIEHSTLELAGTGWSVHDAVTEAAAARLEELRFLDTDGESDEQARILDRLGEGDIPGRFPPVTDLENAGCDLVALAEAADSGLDMDLFGQACEKGLPVAAFVQSVALGDDEIEDIHGMLHLFIDSVGNQPH